MLRPGVFLQNRYEILNRIGSGGMSDVYKAKCHKLNRFVAIKVLKEEFSTDAAFVNKFKLEAQAAARLSHPNIVNIYDVIDEGNLHYIVMELIEGITLKNYIEKKGMLGIKESIGISIQVAQGIAAAHEQNIIHRDIKPQNIIISKDGKVKVADFGIARAASTQTLSVTAMGSVHYISPEQARGGYSDARSDIYSLGITMYEMVTGTLPFKGDNTVTVALAHFGESIIPPSKYNPQIPVSLEQIILKCVEKKPEGRYLSSTELINDLRKSLVTPNENFVKPAGLVNDSMGQTVTISHQEMAQIKEGMKSARTQVQRSPELDVPDFNKQRQKKAPASKKPDDDVNPQIEKILTGVGIAVAVIIVAVLIFVFSQITGLFKFSSGRNNSSPQTTESVQATLSDTEVYMPDVLGLPEDMAEERLKESNLVMRVQSYDYSDKYEKGQIMEQLNSEGSIVSKYSTVNVVVSQGPDAISLENLELVGMNAETARKLLEDMSLTVKVTEEESETVEKGIVMKYSPESVKANEAVELVVSSGKKIETVEMPDLVGKSEEIADEMISDAGLVPGKATLVASMTVPAGDIVSQSVDAGVQVEKGSTIDYEVSGGTEIDENEDEDETTQAETTAPANTGGYKYIASISENYPLKNVFGPGAATSSIQIMVRLKQTVNGKEVTTTLISPRTLEGDQILPIQFSRIEGAYGITEGKVEVVDVTNDTILKTYNISFVRTR